MRRRPRTGTSAAKSTTSRGSGRTRRPRSAAPRASPSASRPRSTSPARLAPDEQAAGSALAGCLLDAGAHDAELTRCGLSRAQLDDLAGNEPLVVEPMQELAVMLGEAHDGHRRARGHIRQRLQLAVLRLLEVRVDRPAVRAALGVAELLVDPLDHVVAERPAELVGVHVRLTGRVAHEVGEEALDDPVLAHDLARALGAGGCEDRFLVLAALDEALGFEPLQHLPGGRARDAEHLADAGRDRLRRPGRGLILADRESQEIDRLEVVVDAVTRCHSLREYS